MENQELFDKVTTTLAINIMSLRARSGKHHMCMELNNQNTKDKYIYNVACAVIMVDPYNMKIYLKMPLREYLAFKKENKSSKHFFRYCFFRKNKFFIDKEKLLNDVKEAYKIKDDEIFEKINKAFYEGNE